MAIGEITTIDRRVYFQADSEWLSSSIELDPTAPPPRREPMLIPQGRRTPLLGVFGDSIPDGWGMKVLHALARSAGQDAASLKPEEYLCMVGSNGPGAIVFEPVWGSVPTTARVDLEALFDEAMTLHRGDAATVAEQLAAAVGGSGGARPKVSLDVLPDGTAVSPAGTHSGDARSYIIKFPTDDDGLDFGSVELAYAAMAQAAGITMPATRPFDIRGGQLRCFGVERFDRPQNAWRPHVISLAAVLNADFREDLTTYETYLQVTYKLAPVQAQLLEAYRRMVFNVLACVRDDHMKNFAFIHPEGGGWGLAPAFDLVPSLTHEHATTVHGKALEISREDARSAFAAVARIPENALELIEDQVRHGVSCWISEARSWGVDPNRIRSVQDALDRSGRAFLADGTVVG